MVKSVIVSGARTPIGKLLGCLMKRPRFDAASL